MTTRRDIVSRRWRRLPAAIALVAALPVPPAAPLRAQRFSDRPPPVPPAAVPDPGAAVSLAPPSGPAAGPALPPPTLTQPAPPPVAVAPPVTAPAAASPSQAVLALSARYGKDLPPIA